MVDYCSEKHILVQWVALGHDIHHKCDESGDSVDRVYESCFCISSFVVERLVSICRSWLFVCSTKYYILMTTFLFETVGEVLFRIFSSIHANFPRISSTDLNQKTTFRKISGSFETKFLNVVGIVTKQESTIRPSACSACFVDIFKQRSLYLSITRARCSFFAISGMMDKQLRPYGEMSICWIWDLRQWGITVDNQYLFGIINGYHLNHAQMCEHTFRMNAD